MRKGAWICESVYCTCFPVSVFVHVCIHMHKYLCLPCESAWNWVYAFSLRMYLHPCVFVFVLMYIHSFMSDNIHSHTQKKYTTNFAFILADWLINKLHIQNMDKNQHQDRRKWRWFGNHRARCCDYIIFKLKHNSTKV